jgi:trk system potassium uptake protein TrkH
LIGSIADFAFKIVVFLYIIATFLRYSDRSRKIGHNLLDIFFLTVLLSIIFAKFLTPDFLSSGIFRTLVALIIAVRCFLVFFSAEDGKSVRSISANALNNPAKTILLSYVVAIFFGSFLLSISAATADGYVISFIDALFTSTSAICVTGLTVVDISSRFSRFGQIVVLLLIQIGGLGVMILSYFSAFLVGKKKLSLEDKITISYLLNDAEASSLSKKVRKIIYISLLIEGVGALLLLVFFIAKMGFSLNTVFFSIFHSVSAFCNAGFALFPDSLVRYVGSFYFNFTIASLIVLGGLSFRVIVNSREFLIYKFKVNILKKNSPYVSLSTNTVVVLLITVILIVSGTLLIYFFEHKSTLLKLDIKTQYLSCFFQSISIRTAGFNTLDFSSFTVPTYLVIIVFMLIGGASGSTAGGIKVNTVGVIFSYLVSFFKESDKVVIFNKMISKEVVLKSFMIVLLSLFAVFISTLILSVTENFKFIQILFEAASAFGTAGVSTGITPDLSFFGKLTIIFLMIAGKVGPLTLLAATSHKTEENNVEYPETNINIT